jgi:hypothetical protein
MICLKWWDNMHVFLTTDFYNGEYVFFKKHVGGRFILTNDLQKAFVMDSTWNVIRKFSGVIGDGFVAKPKYFFDSMDQFKVPEQLEFSL